MRNYKVCLSRRRPQPDQWAVQHPNGTVVGYADTHRAAVNVARALWWQDHTYRHARPLWHPTLHVLQLPLGNTHDWNR